LLNISSAIQNLYSGITNNTIESNTIVPPLLKLQESLYYFVWGVPTDGPTGYRNLGSNSSIKAYYATSTTNFWVDNFSLNANDKTDITNAVNLITSLNSNLGNNINLVLNNPDVQNLRNSLRGFGTLSSQLQAQQMALAVKLGQMGFQINQPTV